jgi:hypothetical protein
MRAVLRAAVLVSGLAPAAVAQPSPADDWRPLVGMCEAYAKANPPPHANGPVSEDWIAACVLRNYFPKANAVALGSCFASSLHPIVAHGAPPRDIQAAINCLASHGNEEQHGWK